MKLTICSLLLLFVIQASAHMKLNTANGVAGSKAARNGGTFNASPDVCGQGGARGANGFTTYKPGEKVTLVWEENSHAVTGVFQTIFSEKSDTQLQPNDKSPDVKLANDVKHNGAGTYSSSFSLPKDVSCTSCSIQVWHTGLNWGTCHDIRIVPDGASFNADTNKIECKSGKLEGGKCSGSSSSSKSKKAKAAKGAGDFFLGLFLFLLIVSVIAALVFGALVVARRKGKLPAGKVSDFVEKGERKLRLDRIGNSSSSTPQARENPPVNVAAASHPAQTTQTPGSPPKPNKGALRIGAKVQARYSGDGKFYPGTVTDMQNGQVLVQYNDFGGDSEWLPYNSVKA